MATCVFVVIFSGAQITSDPSLYADDARRHFPVKPETGEEKEVVL